jgi:hypothetical protein
LGNKSVTPDVFTLPHRRTVTAAGLLLALVTLRTSRSSETAKADDVAAQRGRQWS